MALDDSIVPLDSATHTIEKIRLILANFSYSNDIVQKVKYQKVSLNRIFPIYTKGNYFTEIFSQGDFNHLIVSST